MQQRTSFRVFPRSFHLASNFFTPVTPTLFYWCSRNGAACTALRSPLRSSSFSSATFTGKDGASQGKENDADMASVEKALQKAQEELRAAHCRIQMTTGLDSGSNSSSTSSTRDSDNRRNAFSGTFTYTPGEEQQYAHLHHPTKETYEAMTTDELVTLLQTREKQVLKLREIYERFHYEVDKHFRRTVLDYHDKAMHLSQVHGQIQHSSLRINREALSKMREEQEMLTRDKRLVLFVCVIAVVIFWVWTRRHYVHKDELALAVPQRWKLKESKGEAYTAPGDKGPFSTVVDSPASAPVGKVLSLHRVSPSITGAGAYGGGNWFGNPKRSARYRETSWEKEQREKSDAEGVREAQTNAKKESP